MDEGVQEARDYTVTTLGLHHGDCLDVMAAMEPESVDAIVTDPPYGLEFMGKEWDRLDGAGFHAPKDEGRTFTNASGHMFDNLKSLPRYGTAQRSQAWHQQWAEAAYRVAKPSAYLLAFGGTRTVHRMTVALEDAGWIIRDMLVWGYASGFPKSKASLKPAWEPIVMARKPGPLRDLAIDACRIPIAEGDAAIGGASGVSGFASGYDGTQSVNVVGRWPANVILTDPIFDGGWEGVVGGGDVGPSYRPGDRAVYTDDNRRAYGNYPDREDGWSQKGAGYGDSGTYSRFFLIPKSDRADREPIVPDEAYLLHRARGECDKLGTWEGADLSRSETTDSTSLARATSEAIHPETPTGYNSGTSSPGSPPTDQFPTAIRSTTSTVTSRTTGSRTSFSSIPSPTSASTPAVSSEMADGGSPAESAANSSLWGSPTGISAERDGRSTAAAARVTSGSLSSRSVCGRCGKRLPRVSTHPTVKPTDLMRHLVRLVTPPGGVVLDPFLGSGTTALAAEMEGFPWIGIEREAEYVAIAEARLNGTQRGLGLTG